MKKRLSTLAHFWKAGASALMLAMVVGQVPALAQSTYGTILGTVTDPTGAVVPSVPITAHNQATEVERTVQTDEAGDYRFVNMDPGTYTLTVITQNFAAVKNEDVILPARETVRSDFKLQVQATSQQIVVTAQQEVVSEDLTQASSMSGHEIDALPLNFRATNAPSPINTATLTAGVNEDPSGNLTFSGQLPTATSFTLDGTSVQLVRYGGPTRDLFPSVEGIAEFRVNTAGNDAEFAQPTDLTVVTKSGTNQFHGSGFWFFQRKDWNAMDPIADYNPSLNANTYGGSIGGPIIKDRTFFYFDYEGVRLDQDSLIATQTVPTAWSTGDFSGVPGLTLTNPATGQVIPNNQITSIDPKAAQILKLFFPTPTSGSSNIDSTGNNLNAVLPGKYSVNGYDGRIDQVFNANHRLFGRVTQKNITSSGTDGTAATGALGSTGDTSYNPLMGTFSTTTDATNVAVSYNWVIRPDLLNELRGGWTRANFNYTYPQAAKGDAIISQLGISGLPGSPKNGLGGVPVFYVGNLMGGASNQYGHPRVEGNGIFQLGDNLSWIHNRWTSKFGFDFRRLNYRDNITFNLGDEYGDYIISGAYACPGAQVPKYPDACATAEMLMGIVDYGLQAQNGPDGKPYGYHYSGFGQTEWKVRPDLTLTAGLRYEVNTPFLDATNQLGNFNYKVPGGQLVLNPGENINPIWKEAVGNTPFVLASSVGLPPGLRYTYWGNIQPRLGFAWMPSSSHDTVVRASAGIYSVPVLGAVLYSLLGIDTSFYGTFAPTSATPILSFNNVFSGTPGVSSFPGYRRANQWDLKDPRVYQWNAAFDRNIGFQTVLRLSYVGSHTVDLIYSPNLNQVAPNTASYTDPATGKTVYGYAALTATPVLRQQNLKFPNFAEVLTRNDAPSDKYNAFSVELNRRFSQGLSFNNSYTLAWNKTNALGTAPNSAIPVGGQGDNGGNVNNIFDITSDTGNALYDPRQSFISTLVYDLPIGRGKTFLGNSSRAADLLVGGWNVTGITFLHSGLWLTPYYPSSVYDSSGTNPKQRSVSQQRPDCGGTSGYLSNPTTADFFNASAYNVPAHPVDAAGTAEPIGRLGNCGVGILEGPGTVTFSMSTGKTFHLSERFGIRYEAQFSNLFNVVNWGVPNMNITSNFGLISNAQATGQAGPRTVQMSLRLDF
ncbi:MAG TPA: carboxypeptidase-like regulatory domain-containing protein [Terriglobia bacterium]|nr:carboxypeptidase-like regulatory domain-containing protein [Terriglobia bacterium]